MSESKLTPKEVVERYHERYLEYEAAFNKDPFNEQEIAKELNELVAKDLDFESDEFLDKMVDLIVEKPQKRADVNSAAFKFILFVDFYLMTQKEELSEAIMKDYESLPIKDGIRNFFSIKDGEFVRNEKFELTSDIKAYFKQVVAQQEI